jgi:cytochrome P450
VVNSYQVRTMSTESVASVTELGSQVAAVLSAEPATLADPWPVWRTLRETGPVVRAAGAYWITRYDDARAAFQNTAALSADATRRGSRAEQLRAAMTEPQRAAFDEINQFAGLMVVNTDGTVHDRLRTAAVRAFTPARIGYLKDAAARYAEHLVDQFSPQASVDLMTLAYQIPLMVIGDLLGVPTADREQIKQWSNSWFRYRHVTDDRILISAQAGRDFRSYVQGLAETHRRNPRPGLISDLVGAEKDEQLTADELAAMFFVLLFAGHETTTNLIGSGLLELLGDRAEWEKLRLSPDLASNAVEELLRLVTPVQWSERYATNDLEVSGVSIPAGDSVFIAIAAANRDPDTFDDPDRLDITREAARKHLSFAFGSHFCLGANLAKLEATVVLQTLVRRFPDLELASGSVEWHGPALLRGLQELPVSLGM